MNHDMRMDLFDREQNQRMLKAAVEQVEAGNYYGFEPQWRGFADAENRRLKTKLKIVAKWEHDPDYAEYRDASAALQMQESDLLARLYVACTQNAEITV